GACGGRSRATPHPGGGWSGRARVRAPGAARGLGPGSRPAGPNVLRRVDGAGDRGSGRDPAGNGEDAVAGGADPPAEVRARRGAEGSAARGRRSGMTCLHTRDILAEFAVDALSPLDRRRVERHLDSCPGCAKEAGELLTGASVAAFELPAVAPPPALEDRPVTRVPGQARRRAGRPTGATRALWVAEIGRAHV